MIRVLSVDDSRSVHAFLTEIFKTVPCELLHAYDGQQGLEVVAGQSGQPLDLVLLDWEMPRLTGIETLKKLRSVERNLPVIMLTSKNSVEDISSALSLGANEYVMKPFTRDLIVEKIEAVLGRKLA